MNAWIKKVSGKQKLNHSEHQEVIDKNKEKIIDVLIPLAIGLACVIAVWIVGKAENPGPPGFRLDDAWILLLPDQS